ncbi:hypothetical protein [Actinacidiphila glaucinigra]|uniref:hypothetical protein n=1 Tax=Actinacidiphila glaucinigra TaxID=235986 RepID=UPI002E3736A9|nr:hypothetical protein [Actinacidiphila glaucinigra]
MFMALRGHVRMLAVGLAACAAAVAFPVSASAAPQTAATSSSMEALANPCWRTQAEPNSIFVRSYSSCSKCYDEATWQNYIQSTYFYYCTYNPSNGLFDLQKARW